MAFAAFTIQRRRSAHAAATCVLSPAQTAGPFYFNPHLLRRDITEGRPGTPLRLALQVVDAGSCAPIRDAVVDVWHTDAAGLYSGYANQGENRVDTRGQTFLRGLQVTDADGRVELLSLYPGWYPGRVPHIHFKVHVDDRTYVTSQLYFPEDITQAVYETPPYATRGQSPVSLATDGVLQDGQLARLLMTVQPAENGYVARHTLGIHLPPPPTTTPTPPSCTGDCSEDGEVTIDEVVQGVNIALENAPLEECPVFDLDRDQKVTVAELVAAVNNLLRSCTA